MPTVFVYGTLTDPATAAAVLPAHAYRGSAALRGLHRVDGEYPTLAPGGSVAGRLLATEYVDALDAYEGVDRGLYARVSVPLAGEFPGERETADDGGTATVETYVGDPDVLGADVTWPGEDGFPACVRKHLAEHEVRVVLDEKEEEGGRDRDARED